jgi:hypothetical protein
MMLKRLVLAGCVSSAAMVSSAPAQEQFVGRWAVKPEVCAMRGGDTPQNSALVATDTSLWWYDGYCRIGKMYKAKAVYVQAHCGGNDVAVTLDAQGNRMRVTWGKAKAEELQRCP